MNISCRPTWLEKPTHLIASLALLLGLAFHQAAHAATSSADSNLTTVDTRIGGLLTVSGRVRQSATGKGLAGVLVSVGGQNTTTFADGNFTFTDISLTSGLASAAALYPFTLYGESHVGIDFKMPPHPVNAVFNLPFLGKFGAEAAANISVDYEIFSGEWEAQIGSGADFNVDRPGARPLIPGLTQGSKNEALFWKPGGGVLGLRQSGGTRLAHPGLGMGRCIWRHLARHQV